MNRAIMFKGAFWSKDRKAPKQMQVLYVSDGFDLGIGGHNRYTNVGDEIDAIYCEGRGRPYTIVARKPGSKKRYLGFDYSIEKGECGFYDFDVTEKEIREITSKMEPMAENRW